MKRVFWALAGAMVVAAPAVLARQPTPVKKLHQYQRRVDTGAVSFAPDGSTNPMPGPQPSAGAPDTTFLATYTFDAGSGCSAEGWVGVDIFAQLDDYFHVDDFAGLGGGDFGRLNPLQGNQSLWCGTRPGTGPVLCGYSVLPGYGNSWDQAFCTTNCQFVDADVTIDFLMAWDSEPGYDYTHVQYDECDDNWTTLASYDGIGSGFQSVVIPEASHGGAVRVRFHFTSDGAWSDEDALWDTDGASIIDSLTVNDVLGLVLPTETFEAEAVGAQSTLSANWESCTDPAYGDFSGLFPGVTMVQDDPCLANNTCLWAFISGSTVNYSCGGYPGQTAVPYVNARGQYILNEVWSPQIPWVGSGTAAELRYDVYRDLPLDPLIFYVWHVRWWIDDCPGGWQDTDFVFFGGGKDWLRATFPIGQFTPSGAETVQIALGVADMCRFWCGIFGTGQCHSHAPLFDNVEIYRIDFSGPQWSVRDIDLFQDSFAGDGTVTGTVRADMAIDILPSASAGIQPGDSAVVDVADPEVGLAGDPYTGSGPAVYAYLTVWPDGGKFGPDIASGDQSNNGYERYPLVDSLVHDGKWWYCVRFDTSFTDGNERTGAQNDRYCVDLNDDAFTPGDTICFVFCAQSAGSGSVSYYTQATGTTSELAAALDNPMEFTCLPAGGWLRGGDILYVDGMNERGAQPFFDDAFVNLGLLDRIDRYDIRGPSSSVGNRPGGRVKNVENQLLACYRKIIWSTGNLSDGLVGDGSGSPEKSDDAGMLLAFLDGLDNPGGVYLSGDDIANELSGLAGTSAISLRSKYINYVLVNDNHVTAGLGVSPYVYAEPGSCFDHVTGRDQWVAYGGCPLINNFDVIAPAGTATLEASYWTGPNGTGASGGAVVGQKTLNADSVVVGVLLSGHAFMYIRDDQGGGGGTTPDRWHVMDDVLTWLGNEVPDPTPVLPRATARNDLRQNYPNPFNPRTTIAFELRERAHVRVTVFNVAGQVVKQLVDEEREPSVLHKVTWDGRNDAGAAVSSGVYFYRIDTPGFTKTRKMVLLK